MQTPSALRELPPNAASEIRVLINRTADAYDTSVPSSPAVLRHATFLRNLVKPYDIRQPEWEEHIDPRLNPEQSYGTHDKYRQVSISRQLPPLQATPGYGNVPPPPPSGYAMHHPISHTPMQPPHPYPHSAIGTSVSMDHQWHTTQTYPPPPYNHNNHSHSQANGNYYHQLPSPDEVRSHDSGHVLSYHDTPNNTFFPVPPQASPDDVSYFQTMVDEVGHGSTRWLVRL